MTTTKDNIEERERLIKVKLSEEISANMIMINHLRDESPLPKITDAVYATARALETKLEIKRPLKKEKKTRENRRVGKLKKQIKELRQLVARA